MEIRSISTFGVFQRSIQSSMRKIIEFYLKQVNFVFMIPNPSLDCSYVVLNFWPNLSLVLIYKIVLVKKRVIGEGRDYSPTTSQTLDIN